MAIHAELARKVGIGIDLSSPRHPAIVRIGIRHERLCLGILVRIVAIRALDLGAALSLRDLLDVVPVIQVHVVVRRHGGLDPQDGWLEGTRDIGAGRPIGIMAVEAESLLLLGVGRWRGRRSRRSQQVLLGRPVAGGVAAELSVAVATDNRR